MGDFGKTLVASVIGTFLSLFAVFGSIMLVFIGMAAMSSSNWESGMGKIEDGSVLRISLNGPLKDHNRRRDLLNSIMNYDEPPVIGLFELTYVLKRAAEDERIKGVLLTFNNLQTGLANTEELRRAIVKFKESGKFTMAYAESYSEMDYVIASAVDEVILYPKGYFEWDGLYSKMSYLKGTLKKVDVVPQIFRVGKYKSAIEPFINDKMSDASREQMNAILQGAWKQLLKHAHEKTQLPEEDLEFMAENMSVMFAADALEKGFVNLLASFEEVEEKLKELTAQDEEPKYVSWRAYLREALDNPKSESDNKVAVIFAEGGINTESNDGEGISSRALTKLIHEIRKEEDVKAVVIRVNSPGGSALASDVIWTATQWLKDSKPVVTSFGNVAASGGYYMSAGSQYIFAEPTTITGSIGVFGLTFATKEFWNKKIGMTFDTVKSHRYSDMEGLVRLMDPEESNKVQSMVESIYKDFLTVVTQGRQKLENNEQTHELAQGRVWLGSKALEIGLVDELGGIRNAVEKAAELAELDDYNVRIYPKEKSAIEALLKTLGQTSVFMIDKIVPESFKTMLKMDEKKSLHDKVFMRLPFEFEVR